MASRGIQSPAPPRRPVITICIVGFSDLSRRWAAEQPPGVEIWGLNEVHRCAARPIVSVNGTQHRAECGCPDGMKNCWCKGHQHKWVRRYDRWFQIHPPNWRDEKRRAMWEKKYPKLPWPDELSHAYGRNPSHVEFLKTCGVPLYMQQADPQFPTAIRYPFEEVTATLGIRKHPHGKKWLYATSTPAYMIALALHEHRTVKGRRLKEIRVAGIELASLTEYVWQRPAMEYYLGLATGWGIKVNFGPLGTALLAAPRYAIDPEPINPWVGAHSTVALMKRKELPDTVPLVARVEGADRFKEAAVAG